MDRPKSNRWFNSIVMQYGMRSLKIEACRTLYRKEAAYHVVTDKGDVLLKPFKGAKARLDRVHAYMVWLKKHHFTNMPQWHTTNNRKHWVRHKGQLFYISDWIEGSKLEGNEEDYVRLGEALGRLHQISRGKALLSPSYTKRKIRFFQQEYRLFRRHLRAVRKEKHAAGRWFKMYGDPCIRLAEEAWSTLRRPDIQSVLRCERSSLLHGDVTIPNVIVNEKEVYLVDWEFTGRGSAYYELAKTLNNVTHCSATYMNALLVGYERIRPLAQEERQIIAAFFRLPREAWIAARQSRGGVRSAVFQGLKDSWSQRIDVIQWMDTWAQQLPKQPQEPPQELEETPVEASQPALIPNEGGIGLVNHQGY
ncbi:phosphotransferase [Paenibacillus sp. SI8]|uniref:phosphotransferase n=1 Tax=unclassified Paenibacillus TaxID=185978 RepID=UPI003465823A